MRKPSLEKGQDRKNRETVFRNTGFLSYSFLYPMTGKSRKTFLNFPIFSYSEGKKRQASRENGKENSGKEKTETFLSFLTFPLQAKASLGGTL